MPTLAAPVPAAEQAAVSAGSAVAASVAAPAAAQTLRAMTLLGVIDTAERCRLQSFGADTYASDSRSFPESFFPSIRIAGPNATVDALFGLPSRRGAIVANAIIGPLVIFAIAALCGVVRKRFSVSMRDASPLAAGRVLGVTAAVTGSLAMDGVFASAVVLLTVPGGAPGGDVALALFGMLIVTAIPTAIGAMMYRVFQREIEAGHPIECVPAVVRAKNADAEGTAAAKPATGALWFLFGTETWVGPTEAFEQYRPIFASNRGNSAATTKEWTSSKVFRRRLAMWSFFLDCLMTAVAATGRGWATTLPCTANRKVQLMQFLIAVVAFIFSLVVQPAISPLRRAVDMASGFVMTMGTFALAVLGAESGTLVTRCAVASAFMATVSTLVLVLARHVALPLRGLAICPASAVERVLAADSAPGDDGRNRNLADLFATPLLRGDNGGDDDDFSRDLRTNDNAATELLEVDIEAELQSVLPHEASTATDNAAPTGLDVWAELDRQ